MPHHTSQIDTKPKKSYVNVVLKVMAVMVGLILVLGIFGRIFDFDWGGYSCGGFVNMVEDNLNLPPEFKFYSREYGNCGNTFEGYNSDVMYTVRSTKQYPDGLKQINEFRASMVNLGWEISSENEADYEFEARLIKDPALTGYVSLEGKTFMLSFHADPDHQFHPSSYKIPDEFSTSDGKSYDEIR